MRSRFVLFFLVAGVLLASAVTTLAAIYKWEDENGVVSFQDTPPPAGVHAREVTPNSAYRPDPANPVRVEIPPPPGPSSSATPARRALPKVEIYVTSWCGYCKKAKNFFTSRGIPFTAYDIEKDRAAAQRKAKLSPGGGVPLTVINGQLFRGFSESAYAAALENSH